MHEHPIKVEDLGKVYRLYQHPFDRLKELLHPRRKAYHQRFQALGDVSFEVGKGETVGLIGPNGSGKSTLLKMLASVVTPTTGTVHCKGRVSAMLELGSGFNPELTGLQNVYFYGAVIGMSQVEIDDLLPGILDFADIGDFIHQPVKQYSSGMYVRLAFAVAIQLNPDILLIDEALSVGDLFFQQKCFRKIREIRQQGCTIVFCSHDLRAIQNFCDRVIWLEKGKIKQIGPTKLVMEQYQAANFWGDQQQHRQSRPAHHDSITPPNGAPEGLNWYALARHENYGEGKARLLAVGMEPHLESICRQLQGQETFSCYFQVRCSQPLDAAALGFQVMNQIGEVALGLNNWLFEQPFALPEGKSILKVSFELPRLANGPYALSVGLAVGAPPTIDIQHFVHEWMVIEFATEGPKRFSVGQVMPSVASFSIIDPSP